jgi:hypothetical protein
MSGEENGIASRSLSSKEIGYISNEIRKRQEEEEMDDVDDFVVCYLDLFISF